MAVVAGLCGVIVLVLEIVSIVVNVVVLVVVNILYAIMFNRSVISFLKQINQICLKSIL